MIEVTTPWGARMWVNAAYMTGAPRAAVEEPTAAAVPKVISHGALPADAPALPNAASAAPAPLPADAGASPEGESGSDAAALARLSPLQLDAALPVPKTGAILAQAAAPDCADTQMENDMMEIDGEAVDVATLKQALLLIKKQGGTSSGAGLPARSQSIVAQGGSFLEEPSCLFRKLEPPSASAHASLEAGPPKTKASSGLTLLAHDATALYEAAELQQMQLRSSALHAVPLKTEAALTETVKEEHVKREQAVKIERRVTFEQPTSSHAPALPSAAVASAATAPPPLVGEPSSASGVGAGSVLLPPPPAAPVLTEGPQPVPPTLAAQTTLAETTVPTRPHIEKIWAPKI